jgi:hypothetical protein
MVLWDLLLFVHNTYIPRSHFDTFFAAIEPEIFHDFRSILLSTGEIKF